MGPCSIARRPKPEINPAAPKNIHASPPRRKTRDPNCVRNPSPPRRVPGPDGPENTHKTPNVNFLAPEDPATLPKKKSFIAKTLGPDKEGHVPGPDGPEITRKELSANFLGP